MRARSTEGLTEKTGRLPVNPSGGLKAKGHPIGATGVSMHALTAMQLTGDAGDMQVKDATPRRRLQHGRHRGRELRQHPGADQVAVVALPNSVATSVTVSVTGSVLAGLLSPSRNWVLASSAK